MILDDTKLKILCERHAEALQQRIKRAKGKKTNSLAAQAVRHQFDVLVGIDLALGTAGYTLDYVTGEIRKLD